MAAHLHHGDWREVVESWPRPCVLVTDPPYGIDYASNFTRVDGHRFRGVTIDNDETTHERDAAIEAIGWLAAAVFGHLWKVPHWGSPRHVLTWNKGASPGLGDLSFPWGSSVEAVAVYGDGWAGKRSANILRGYVVPRNEGPGCRQHPTEKPIPTLREIVSKAPPGLPIVDPFMGSGTTGVAAILEGREFYGAEIVEEYFNVANARINGATPDDGAQRGLWAADPSETGAGR